MAVLAGYFLIIIGAFVVWWYLIPKFKGIGKKISKRLKKFL